MRRLPSGRILPDLPPGWEPVTKQGGEIMEVPVGMGGPRSGSVMVRNLETGQTKWVPAKRILSPDQVPPGLFREGKGARGVSPGAGGSASEGIFAGLARGAGRPIEDITRVGHELLPGVPAVQTEDLENSERLSRLAGQLPVDAAILASTLMVPEARLLPRAAKIAGITGATRLGVEEFKKLAKTEDAPKTHAEAFGSAASTGAGWGAAELLGGGLMRGVEKLRAPLQKYLEEPLNKAFKSALEKYGIRAAAGDVAKGAGMAETAQYAVGNTMAGRATKERFRKAQYADVVRSVDQLAESLGHKTEGGVFDPSTAFAPIKDLPNVVSKNLKVQGNALYDEFRNLVGDVTGNIHGVYQEAKNDVGAFSELLDSLPGVGRIRAVTARPAALLTQLPKKVIQEIDALKKAGLKGKELRGQIQEAIESHFSQVPLKDIHDAVSELRKIAHVNRETNAPKARIATKMAHSLDSVLSDEMENFDPRAGQTLDNARKYWRRAYAAREYAASRLMKNKAPEDIAKLLDVQNITEARQLAKLADTSGDKSARQGIMLAFIANALKDPAFGGRPNFLGLKKRLALSDEAVQGILKGDFSNVPPALRIIFVDSGQVGRDALHHLVTIAEAGARIPDLNPSGTAGALTAQRDLLEVADIVGPHKIGAIMKIASEMGTRFGLARMFFSDKAVPYLMRTISRDARKPGFQPGMPKMTDPVVAMNSVRALAAIMSDVDAVFGKHKKMAVPEKKKVVNAPNP